MNAQSMSRLGTRSQILEMLSSLAAPAGKLSSAGRSYLRRRSLDALGCRTSPARPRIWRAGRGNWYSTSPGTLRSSLTPQVHRRDVDDLERAAPQLACRGGGLHWD